MIAPAAGRIVFAAPFRRYEHVLIIDHGNGWQSVITNLAALDVATPQAATAPRVAGAVPLPLHSTRWYENTLSYPM